LFLFYFYYFRTLLLLNKKTHKEYGKTERRKYLAGYMGVLSPKLDVDVVVQSYKVADWQRGCSSSSSGALIDVDDC
jgi:hypothetical protein